MYNSADSAVSLYIDNYRQCRDFDQRVYGKDIRKEYDRAAIRRGSAFALSELYGLDLNNSGTRVCFRACHENEPDPLPIAQFTGVFDCIQDLFTNISAAINNKGGSLISFSRSLTAALFRYSRATELKIAVLNVNSFIVDCSGTEQIIPFCHFTSAEKLAGFKFENFQPKTVTAAICDCERRGLDQYLSDWNISAIKRTASFRKDCEVLTNEPSTERISGLDAIRRKLTDVIIDGADPSFPSELINKYLAEYISFERESYQRLVKLK